MEKTWSSNNQQIFVHRMRFVQLGFLILFIIIFLGLVYRQILRPMAAPGKIVKVEIPVARGRILDRAGTVLATSVPSYGVYLNYWEIREREKKEPGYLERLKSTLAKVLNMSSQEIEERTRPPYPLVRKILTPGEYQELKSQDLTGLDFVRTYQRVYPFGIVAAHVLGFVGSDGDGLEGVELFYDAMLKGKDGLSLVVRDGCGRLIPSLEKVLCRPEQGADLILTIDFTIQSIVEEEIDRGQKIFQPAGITAIVMEANTGEILALANRPVYDPNCFQKVPADWRRNRAVTDYYEPGSIFKIVTAAACLEEGKVKLGQEFFCENGRWYVRNHWLHDVHPYGTLTFEQIIIKSSNIGTVKLAFLLGEETLYHYCKLFGFGEVTGIDIPGEIPGILRPLESWSSYSITAVPIGQEVGINAVQGARAMAALANGGRLVKPYLVKGFCSGANVTYLHREDNCPSILSRNTCQIISNILEKVVSSEGTAQKASIEGYPICGKTGTAQKCIGGRYSSRVVASFVGYLDQPETNLVVLVSVDEPKGAQFGGSVAAPIFRNILWRILQYKKIAPVQHEQFQADNSPGVSVSQKKDNHETKRAD